MIDMLIQCIVLFVMVRRKGDGRGWEGRRGKGGMEKWKEKGEGKRSNEPHLSKSRIRY